MELDVQRAIAEAKQLASEGSAWRALGRLQEAEIEDVLLRLLRSDIGDLPRSHQEQAVAHAVTALYGAWRSHSDIRSPLAWLKTAARRKASDFRRYHPAEGEYDPTNSQRTTNPSVRERIHLEQQKRDLAELTTIPSLMFFEPRTPLALRRGIASDDQASLVAPTDASRSPAPGARTGRGGCRLGSLEPKPARPRLASARAA